MQIMLRMMDEIPMPAAKNACNSGTLAAIEINGNGHASTLFYAVARMYTMEMTTTVKILTAMGVASTSLSILKDANVAFIWRCYCCDVL